LVEFGAHGLSCSAKDVRHYILLAASGTTNSATVADGYRIPGVILQCCQSSVSKPDDLLSED